MEYHGGQLFKEGSELESTLVVGLFSSIVFVQVLFMFLSAVLAPKLLTRATGNPESAKWLWTIRMISFLWGPLMPAITFACFVFFREKEHEMKKQLRDLETGHDINNNNEMKLSKFIQIQRLSFTSALCHRYFSYYRVIQASIESFTMMNVLILIQIVSGHDGDDENKTRTDLYQALQAKIVQFFDFEGADSSLSSLYIKYLTDRLTYMACIAYSVFMVVGAMTRYQCKNKNMTLGGQLVYSLYVTSLLVARLTMCLALFSTAAAADPSHDPAPMITVKPAAFIWMSFMLIHAVFIFLFKWFTIKQFKEAPLEDQLVHVMANLVVVIPFANSDHRLEENVEDNSSAGKADLLTPPLPPLSESFSFARLANCKWLLTKEVAQLWWKDPTKDINADMVIDEMKKKGRSDLVMFGKQDVQTVLDILIKNKFVNKKSSLRSPRRTKHEYFWLFVGCIVVNVSSLALEVFNGGLSFKEEEEQEQKMYVSWDVRLGSFLAGLVFLTYYYQRKHVLKELMLVKGLGQKDEPMQAVPDVEKLLECLSPKNPCLCPCHVYHHCVQVL